LPTGEVRPKSPDKPAFAHAATQTAPQIVHGKLKPPKLPLPDVSRGNCLNQAVDYGLRSRLPGSVSPWYLYEDNNENIGGILAPRIFVAFLLTVLGNPALAEDYEAQTGDIVFHTSQSDQSNAVQLVTKSKYTHMGIVHVEGKRVYVLEAVEPVKRTRLRAWIARGEDGRYVVKRLKNAKNLLTRDALKKMNQAAQKIINKPTHYDACFEWSNDRLYCSELVWKLFKVGTGLKIGKVQRMKEFDLSHEVVKRIRRVRPDCPFADDEKVVSPAEMFDSPLLKTVFSNENR
jgi:hypothetical protein